MKKTILKITTTTLLILTLPIHILINKSNAITPASTETYEGIDVSGWQETINYSEVKNAGIEIVYIKASEGYSYQDPYFNENYTNAKANGLKVGFYHYLTARTQEEAQAQAEFFATVIKQKEPDCKLAMDFESFGELTTDEINQIGITFMQTVQQITEKQMIIYSDTNNAINIFTGELTKYPLWVAQYEVNEPSSNGNWSTWAGWQYTDMGEIPGINGYVDRDKFTKEIFLQNKEPINTSQQETENTQIKNDTNQITIQQGDTLSELAIKYNTTVTTLAKLNNIQNPNIIYVGEILILPTKETDKEVAQTITTSKQNYYIVKAGDTLDKIAQKYQTTALAIAQENNIQNINLIYIGQKLKIPTDTYDMNHTLYKIKWGDTLWSISRKYGISIATIVKLNRIQNPNLIYAGKTIRI